jgi:hypothetical protein
MVGLLPASVRIMGSMLLSHRGFCPALLRLCPGFSAASYMNAPQGLTWHVHHMRNLRDFGSHVQPLHIGIDLTCALCVHVCGGVIYCVSLIRGCATRVRATCPSRAKPTWLRIPLSHVQSLHIGIDLTWALSVRACAWWRELPREFKYYNLYLERWGIK